MRTFVIGLILFISLVCGATKTSKEMRDAMLDKIGYYSDYAKVIMQDRIADQERIDELDSFIDKLKDERKEAAKTELPLRQPYKIMNPRLANLVAKGDLYNKVAKRDHTHVPNTSPNELMYMKQLQRSVKNANKALSRPAQLTSNTSKRLGDLQSLVDQMDRITRVYFLLFYFIFRT